LAGNNKIARSHSYNEGETMQRVFSVVGKKIHPGMVVDIFLERASTLAPCPDRFRAILILSGSAYLMIDGEKIFVEAQSILTLNGSEKVAILKAEEFSCRIVYFKASVINFQLTREMALLPFEEQNKSPFRQDLFWLDPFTAPSGKQRVIQIPPGSFEHALGLLDTLDTSLFTQVDSFWPCRSRSFFLEFLFYLRNLFIETANDVAIMTSDSGLPGKMEDILLYLHTNFRLEIELKDLCDKFAINRTSINQLFRLYLDQTAIHYLIALRVRFACLLLRDTSVPVKEIVWRSGFRDIVNFHRTFKRITSMTPLEYRRKFCMMLAG